jgi:hypothetical protein
VREGQGAAIGAGLVLEVFCQEGMEAHERRICSKYNCVLKERVPDITHSCLSMHWSQQGSYIDDDVPTGQHAFLPRLKRQKSRGWSGNMFTKCVRYISTLHTAYRCAHVHSQGC